MQKWRKSYLNEQLGHSSHSTKPYYTAYKPCYREKLFIKKTDLVLMGNACSLVPPSVRNFFSLFYSYIINSAVSTLNASTTVIIASGIFHWKFLMSVPNMRFQNQFRFYSTISTWENFLLLATSPLFRRTQRA